MLKKLNLVTLTLLMLLGGVALTGCNTIEGAGKDIQRGGEKIERAGRS